MLRRPPPLLRLLPLGALLALPLACAEGEADDDSGALSCPEPAPPAEAICNDAVDLPESGWFTDVTAEVGLTGIDGNRIATADLDGDLYPDLIVEPISTARSDEEAGIRRYVLMNRPGPDGGRIFEDATEESGYYATRDGGTGRAAQAKVFADVDNDGDLDVYSGVYADLEDSNFEDHGDRGEILVNDGTGHFTLGPQSDLYRPNGGTLAGAAFTDYDRDGRVDLYTGYWYRDYGSSYAAYGNRLYRNRGELDFQDVTDAVGMSVPDGSDPDDLRAGTSAKPSYGVTVCDVDDDGDPDLLGSSYGRAWNELWLQDGGAFTEVGRDTGFAGDENVDYCDNQYYACACQLDPDYGTCATHPPCASVMISCSGNAGSWWGVGYDDQPFRNNGNTFTTVCGDIDNDGDMDLYSAEIRHWHIGDSSDASELLLNDGGSPPAYSRPGNEAMGLDREWDNVDWNEGDLMAAFMDFDNDGRKDVFLGSSDYPDLRAFLFRQKADGTFAEVAEKAGIAHWETSGIAIADFDRDGDLDVVVGSSTFRNTGYWETNEVHMYRNEVGQDGNSLRVRLRGTRANAAGIGARVTVEAGGVVQTQEVSGGYGHMGQHNDVVLHFGLGDACAAERVTVRWPDAELTTEAHCGVAANELVTITQGGDAEYAPRP